MNQIMISTLIIFMSSIGALALCEAASISTNINHDVVCQGEKLTLTCVSEGNSQRWNIRKEDGAATEVTFIASNSPVGTNHTWNEFTWRVISIDQSHFEVKLSVMVTNAVNNAVVECSGQTTPDVVTIRMADEPSPPQNLTIRSVEHHPNDLTVVVAWEPASLDSRVDFYQYQLINSLTEVRVYNTTNTTAVLSGVSYNVNISFVISAYNCRGESQQATLQINSDISTPTTALTPSGKKSDILLISTSFASAAIIIVLLVVCVIVGVVFVKQLRRKRLVLSHDVELYTEIENGIPIYEAVDKMLNSPEPVNEADMSYVDMCGGVSHDPVYDSAEVKIAAANDVCKVDETLKSTECFNLSNNGTHYQNIQEEKYSHCSKLSQHQQPTGRSIYDD